tara:strand:- start:1445 stop:1678 length:234 start_codon:yes stop_codon:yes gene_type:complete
MSPEVALLHDTWESIKHHVPKKERLNIAEVLIRTFDDNVNISEVEDHINEFDSVMKAAIVSHFDIGLDEDEDDEDWE